MPMEPERYGIGQVEQVVGGLVLRHQIVSCCPGDWPAIKELIPDADQWSTVRLGTTLMAVGPPSGQVVETLRRLTQRKHAADRVRA